MTFLRRNIWLIFLLIFFSILYFWNLGGFSLSSWDEAWYGAISKNLAGGGSWLVLSFNGEPYFDHPPFGFWLQALSQRLLGVNEFAVRLPSVVWGVIALIFIYQIAKKWSGTLAGITSMIVLGTCIWFVLRVRSGNLDAILIGNMLGSLYWTLKAKENNSYLPLMFLSILMTILTKSAVGFGLILICFYGLLPLKKSFIPKLFLGLSSLLLVLLLWSFAVQFLSGLNPLIKMLKVGTRQGLPNLWGWQYVKNNLFYLHMGVEEWYYPMISGLILSLFSLKRKKVRLLWLWLFLYLFLFLPNRKTELWHLFPAYPALALLVGLGLNRFKYLKIILFLFILVIFLRQSQRLISLIKKQKGVSVEAALAKEVKKGQGKFYFDGEDIPIAVYYSERRVYPVKYHPPPFNKIDYVLNNGEGGALVITQTNNLKDIKREWREIKKIAGQSLVVLREIH